MRHTRRPSQTEQYLAMNSLTHHERDETRPGILNIPADLPLVLAANPLNEPVEQTLANAAADYNPGGDGSPG